MSMFRHIRHLPTILRRLQTASLPLRTCFDVTALMVARRVGIVREWSLHLSPGAVYLARDTLAEDFGTFLGIVWREDYRSDYQGAAVIDVGAHRGYYGAYALWRGAQVVLSFEPEVRNYDSLDRAAQTYRRRGRDWRTYNVAVGSSRDKATLNATKYSLSHSLLQPGESVTVRQEVSVVPMADIVAEAQALGHRLVVKVNAEGSECDIVLGVSADVWRGVAELFVQTHDFAPCGQEELVAHVRQAGLVLRGPVRVRPHIALLAFARNSRAPDMIS